MENPQDIPQDEMFEMVERRRRRFFGLPFTFTTYHLSNKTLTVKIGLLDVKETGILLYRIMDTSLQRSFFQKMFRLGSIQIASSDQSMPGLVIRNIKNARHFKEVLDEWVIKERVRMRFRTENDEDTNEDDVTIYCKGSPPP